MACAHLPPAVSFQKTFLAGLDASLQNFSELPGALSVARNGGSELAMRSLVLAAGHLEKSTGCYLLAEAGKKRADAALHCSIHGCGELKAVIEFKHNLLHTAQRRSIEKNFANAPTQLRNTVAVDHKCQSYYVHFIFELLALPGSTLQKLHNQPKVTTYKRFQSEEELVPFRQEVQEIMGPPEFATYTINDVNDKLASSRLHCWVFDVPAEGKLIPLVRQ